MESSSMAAFSENSMKIWKTRYLEGNETLEQRLWAVAGGNQRWYDLMISQTFLPNSPTLFNMGRDNGCTSSACFVFDFDDSMTDGPNSIVETRRKAISVAKAGGGVGYYFGNLRPRGSLIKSVHRKACGPVAVLRDMHYVSHLITQGGKRELAQMGVLPVWHDDVEEFIHCKDKDPQGLGSFNISVSWPDDRVKEAVSVADTRSKTLWRDQVKSAWGHGCPGMFFPDAVNRANPNKHLGLINAPNPCFTGDTKVWTIRGPKRFDELVGCEIPVLTEDLEGHLLFKTMRRITKTRENERVYRVTVRCRNGRAKKGSRAPHSYGHFSATADHPVFLRSGGQRLVKDLQPGDRLASVYRRRANQNGYLSLKNTAGDVDMEHRIVASWLHGGRPPYPDYHVHHKNGDKTDNDPDNLEVQTSREHNALKMIGSNNPVVRFPEKNVFRRTDFRQVYGDGGGFKGRRHTEESRRKTSESLKRHHARRKSQNHEVLRVEYVGRQDVYDGTVDDTHRFFIHTEDDGGVLVHNCGETPNRNGEPCNLGSINLVKMFVSATRSVDFTLLWDTAYACSEFLDNILDRNVFPHPSITEAALLTRKLGLGVMGWADLLALLHVHYDTQEAVDLGEKVMKTVSDAAVAASKKMAETKGPYRGYHPDKTEAECRRNETNTSIAPTGTIAILTDCWGSIEPHFALEWDRTTAEGMKIKEHIHVWDRLDGFVPKTADQVDLEWHVRHQAAFQKYTDLGVSKTINLPRSATVDDVGRAYHLMWESGCKGGTVYRDGCRDEQVLVSEKTKSVFLLGGSKKADLPKTRDSLTHEFRAGETKGYLTVGLVGDMPAELFLRVSKIGSAVSGMLDTWAISFSIALQSGVPLESLCRHHVGSRFEPSGMTGDKDIPVCTSIPDYVARWLLKRFLDQTPDNGTAPKAPGRSGQLCPDCGAELVYQSGCLTCTQQGCGWTKCG